MDRLLNVTSALSIALILLVLISVRRAHIRVEYSVSWLVAGVVLLVFTRSHWVLEQLAHLLGITYSPLALLLIAFSVFMMVFFRFSVILSHLKDANIALAQRVAILEFQLRSVHEEKAKTNG